MPARPEAALERRVLLACDAPDVWLARNEVGTAYHTSITRELCARCRPLASKHFFTHGLGVGSPDIMGSVAGRIIGLELKAQRGVLLESQRVWHAAARKRGVMVYEIRSEEEALAAIEEVRRG